MRLLEKKGAVADRAHAHDLIELPGLLLRHFTQNIDTLERVAGINPDLVVEVLALLLGAPFFHLLPFP